MNGYSDIIKNIENLKEEHLGKLLEHISCLKGSKGNIIIPIEDNKIKIINANNILFVKEPKKGITIIRTHSEEIEYKNCAYSVVDYLEKIMGDIFKIVNNGLLINIGKVIHYHSYYHKVYFTKDIYANVTGATIKHLSRLLGKDFDYDRCEGLNPSFY